MVFDQENHELGSAKSDLRGVTHEKRQNEVSGGGWNRQKNSSSTHSRLMPSSCARTGAGCPGCRGRWCRWQWNWTEAREQLTETLRRHTTTEALDQFGEWIIECESAEELLQRIRARSNGIS